MKDNHYSFNLTVGVLIITAIAWWVGISEGKNNACDVLNSSILENNRVRMVIMDEFGESYLQKMEGCSW